MEKTAGIIDGETIYIYDLTAFDAQAIMHSGQVFRYRETQNGYRLTVGSDYAEIFLRDNETVIKCSDAAFFWNYFDLDTDYNKIKESLKGIPQLAPAIAAGGGIRILKQPFIETVISFIISANNNIKRFTKTLDLLCSRFGSPLKNGHFAFPTLTELSKLTVADFQSLGCGYRSPYLTEAVKQLQAFDIHGLSKKPNAELAKTLKQIYGVGPKVAACIMLFCGDFHRLNSAPVDTWIAKALGQLTESDKIILMNHKFSGVAQQYIFYYLQHLRKSL